MALYHYYNGTAIQNAIELRGDSSITSRATLGSVETLKVSVEDPAGTRDFLPFKRWHIVEDTANNGRQVIWSGHVGLQTIRRDQRAGLRAGTARVWDLDLVEDNGVLAYRVFSASTANRPAETVDERMAWLLAASEYTSYFADHGLIASSSTTMDPTDYRGRTATDVLGDIAVVKNWNYYVRWSETYNERQLALYHPNTSSLDTSALQISNVMADVDNVTTWWAGTGARMEADPSRLAAGAYVAYTGGSYYGIDAGTGSTYAYVDQVAPTANVKTLASATALGTRFLADHAVQDVSVRGVEIFLPAHNINDLRHGQAITCKFQHFRAPYNDWTDYRVMSKSISRGGESQAYYIVTLDLSVKA